MSPASDDLAVPTRSSELQVRGQAAPEVSATWGHPRAVSVMELQVDRVLRYEGFFREGGKTLDSHSPRLVSLMLTFTRTLHALSMFDDERKG